MRPYIKLDACDNTPGCPVINACPGRVFHYNYNLKKLLVNDNDCTGCQLCVYECEYDAVIMVEEKEIDELHLSEEKYGLARARLIAGQYGIEPQEISKDKDIVKIKQFGELNEKELSLVYVYGTWLAESYIGYSFFKEMVAEIKEEVSQVKIVKMDVEDYNSKVYGELTGLPAYIIHGKGEVLEKYYGIKNPMYFTPELIEILKKNMAEETIGN